MFWEQKINVIWVRSIEWMIRQGQGKFCLRRISIDRGFTCVQLPTFITIDIESYCPCMTLMSFIHWREPFVMNKSQQKSLSYTIPHQTGLSPLELCCILIEIQLLSKMWLWLMRPTADQCLLFLALSIIWSKRSQAQSASSCAAPNQR